MTNPYELSFQGYLTGTHTKKLIANSFQKCFQGPRKGIGGHVFTSLPLGNYLIYSTIETNENIDSNQIPTLMSNIYSSNLHKN